MSSKPIISSSTEECRKVRKACSLLWKYESSTNIEKRYQQRNIYLLFAILISFVIAVVILGFLIADNSNFECSIEFDSNKTETSNVIKLQFCSYITVKTHQRFMLAFAISLLFQKASIAVGIYIVRSSVNRKTNDEKGFSENVYKEKFLSSQGVMTAKYSFFMMLFWKNSKATSWQKLEKLVYYIFYQAVIKMEMNLGKAISDETEMISLYCNLRNKGSTNVIKEMQKEIRKDTFCVNDKQHADILRCIGLFKPKLKLTEYAAFIELLSEKGLWELLANVLVAELSDWVEGDISGDIFGEFIINTNEIGQPYRLGRSILYYFIPDGIPLNLRAASILSHLLDHYVHNDGKCERVCRCIYEAYLVTNEMSDLTFPIFQSDDLSQQQIKRFCVRHTEKTQGFQERLTNPDNKTDKEATMSEYVEYLKDLSKEVSRYKFDEWDENIDKLAQFANSEEQWVLLVALFNTFILPESENRISGCSVKKFTLISGENRNTSPPASILYYALRKPTYLKNIRPHAIRHILDCTSKQVTEVRKPDGKIVNAAEYIKENSDLASDEKKKLLSFVEMFENHRKITESPKNDVNPDVPGSSTQDTCIPPTISASASSLQSIEKSDEVIVKEPTNDENPDVPGSSTQDTRIPPTISASASSLQIIDEKSDKVIVEVSTNDENADVPGSSTQDSRIPPTISASASSLQSIEKSDEMIVKESTNDENHDVPGSSTQDSRIPPSNSAFASLLEIVDEKSDEVIVKESTNNENHDVDSGNSSATSAILRMNDEESSEKKPLLRRSTKL